MKKRILLISVTVLMLATGSALAQMGGWGNMGPGMDGWNYGNPGPGTGPSTGPGTGPGWGYMGSGRGYGKGYGMGGIGGMGSMMLGNTISYGYLDSLNPIDTPEKARTAIQAFINAANSNLQISELWEYGTVYKAELSDTKGAMAFDLMVDKFTGAVMPEMGLSMMLNASYGKNLYKTPTFGKNLTVTPDQAAGYAQTFINNNHLAYTLGTIEIYPGYYKFHTDHAGSLRMDIMVDGYDGGVWMNTFLGLPVNKF